MLDNLVLVLVQPQDVVNVAAVVRLMSNFGLSRLRLVEPAAFDPYRIQGIAHHTEAIMAATQRFPSLAEAIADCSLVVGTTARPREARRERFTPRQAAPVLLQQAAAHPGAPVAVLFGRETDGLSNAELDHCHFLLTIPTAANKSLNLAQAALVVAYELWMAANPRAAETPPSTVLAALAGTEGEKDPAGPLAPNAHLAEMFGALEQVLRALYPRTSDERMAHSMARLRALLLRAAPRSAEARMLSHLFAHLAHAIRPEDFPIDPSE